MEAELVASGRFAWIETRGRRTGEPRAVTVGYLEDDAGPHGTIRVAAGAPKTAWARNLLADPGCRVRIGESDTFDAVAEPLDAAEHARTIVAMILRYGTPAENLGRGPTFRLRPVSGRAAAG